MATAEARRRDRTVADLAEEIGVSRVSVYRWIDSGITVAGRHVQLDSYRLGTKRFVTDAAWAAFNEACNRPPNAAQLQEDSRAC